MKRCVCTVATGLLLALVSAGTAAAGLPLLGETQLGSQSTSFGDQTVDKQRNDAQVDQQQGNGNLNISPAIAIFGDAGTKNAQGNGKTAVAAVDQSNTATQSQFATQSQSLEQGGSSSDKGSKKGHCCGGQSQAGTQEATFGDQSVGEQKKDAGLTQQQGNGNVNVSPAIAIFGDATTWNAQGNGNTASADVDQSNSSSQTQDSRQSQDLEQHGSKSDGGCCAGQSQTGEQTTAFGGQSVDKQRNDAQVDQQQGNGNLNISPAIAIFGDAGTKNAQGNGNTAVAAVDQSNTATQSQSATQTQNLGQSGGSCCKPGGGWKPSENGCKPAPDGGLKSHSAPCAKEPRGDCWPPKGQFSAHGKEASCMPMHQSKPSCCGDGTQTGSQSASLGHQAVGEQKNGADVAQHQGNENASVSPALGKGEKKQRRSCGPHAKKGKPGHGGAWAWNAQGNGNAAGADVDQGNTVDQSQQARQVQGLRQPREGVSVL